jgi:antitoxin HicB
MAFRYSASSRAVAAMAAALGKSGWADMHLIGTLKVIATPEALAAVASWEASQHDWLYNPHSLTLWGMIMQQLFKLPLVLEPQPEGGYTITCPLLPGLVTEADTLEEVMPHITDALRALVEGYEDLGRPLPAVLQSLAPDSPFLIEAAIQLEIGWDTGKSLENYESSVAANFLIAAVESHRKWHHPDKGVITSIPDWGSKDLKQGTLRQIIRDLGLDWDDFTNAWRCTGIELRKKFHETRNLIRFRVVIYA